MYLLDSNIFITAKNRHYGFEFVPAFWDWLDNGHAAGVLCSTSKVRQELLAGQDELTRWANGRSPLFLSPDQAMLPSLRLLTQWATSASFTQAAVATFLASADFELIAYAHAHQHTVVTHEQPSPLAKKRILIPDACDAMGVPWMDPFSMLKQTRARFVLGVSA
ncbi:DUF4411 family protein [Arthrobacter sp. AET 35A]|uniref:DUF4411 family protein n=1 Tax=Arthrobacter sp. AET 35A TaxID=2292643 RepID=UPI0017840343|nr:DUF4411 family protein [Arthrobacter sp. AET 35A]MBE0011738.1 DUF4411 family protein [Arthrobacter sp. AET 35A]